MMHALVRNMVIKHRPNWRVPLGRRDNFLTRIHRCLLECQWHGKSTLSVSDSPAEWTGVTTPSGCGGTPDNDSWRVHQRRCDHTSNNPQTSAPWTNSFRHITVHAVTAPNVAGTVDGTSLQLDSSPRPDCQLQWAWMGTPTRTPLNQSRASWNVFTARMVCHSSMPNLPL